MLFPILKLPYSLGGQMRETAYLPKSAQSDEAEYLYYLIGRGILLLLFISLYAAILWGVYNAGPDHNSGNMDPLQREMQFELLEGRSPVPPGLENQISKHFVIQS